MKQLTNSALLLLMAALVFSNVQCKKDEKTKTELLTAGQWRISALTIMPGIDFDGDGDLDTDIYSLSDACEKDNYFVFNENGTYEVNEGATKCDPSDPQTNSGNWSFVENETKFNLDGDVYNIETLTKNQFRISISASGYTATETFSK